MKFYMFEDLYLTEDTVEEIEKDIFTLERRVEKKRDQLRRQKLIVEAVANLLNTAPIKEDDEWIVECSTAFEKGEFGLDLETEKDIVILIDSLTKSGISCVKKYYGDYVYITYRMTAKERDLIEDFIDEKNDQRVLRKINK